MIIEINAIYNFLVSLFLVTGAFMLGMFLKNKIYPQDKQHEELRDANPINNQSVNSPPQSETPHRLDTSTQNDNIYKQVMEGAQNEAKALLEQTTQKAHEMISGIRQTNEKIEEDLDRVLTQIASADIKSLKETTAKFDQEYKQILTGVETQMQKTATDMIAKTQQEYNKKLDEFMKKLLESGTNTQIQVDKKTAELLSIAEADIAEYKKQKMANADEQVRILVQRAFRDVLRESIPDTLHEDLIMKSLDEAKRDELFKL